MIKFQYKARLRPNDSELLKLAVVSNLNYLFPEQKQLFKKLNMIVKIQPQHAKQPAWVGYPNPKNKKTLIMGLNSNTIDRTGANTWERMFTLLEYTCHECVHVRQYLTEKDMKAYDPILQEEQYYNSAYEIEAYGRTQWLMVRLERSFKQYYESVK